MKTKIIKKDYKTKDIVITKNNICELGIMPARRLIREKQVNGIYKALLSGENPIKTLVVNNRGGVMRLIDGNHRFEATKRFYTYETDDVNTKIECELRIYTNLSDGEERQIYSDEANRSNETVEDRLNLYQNTIQFWKNIQNVDNGFPCKASIYKLKNNARLRLLIDSLVTTKNSSIGTYTPIQLKKEDIVKIAMTINWDDFQTMKEFMTFFQENFGVVDSSNLYMKTQMFMPLFDIWAKNKHMVDEKMLSRRFKKIINRPDIIQFAGINCRLVNIKMRRIMVEYMNFGTSVNKFI